MKELIFFFKFILRSFFFPDGVRFNFACVVPIVDISVFDFFFSPLSRQLRFVIEIFFFLIYQRVIFLHVRENIQRVFFFFHT